MNEIGVRHGLSVVQQLGSGGIFIPPSSGGAGPTPTGATGVDFETTDYLSGQSFAGSNLAFDMYYVSGTMPFGLPATAKNTWIPVSESGSYTVENIMQNCEGRMANLTLDSSVDMPMKSGADVAVNNAGADFTLNGVVSTSGRGPNQENCEASEFDGSADYIYKTVNFTTKVLTCCFNISINIFEGSEYPITLNDLKFVVRLNDSKTLNVLAKNSGGATVMNFNTVAIYSEKRTIQVAFFVDLTDTLKRGVSVNGEDKTGDTTWFTYTDDEMSFNSNLQFGRYGATTNYLNGAMGEAWFDTVITELSEFWDSETNLPIPVSNVIENTVVTPLFALPIRADDPGNNDLGSGGALSVVSGPFVGARGASEYWSRGAVVDGTNYLTGSIYCESLVKWKSLDSGVTWAATYSNAETVTTIGNGTDNGVVSYYWGTSEDINWALEENKLRVTDGLGFPVKMDDVISGNPLSVLGLDFSDTTNFGANKAGADYTETGTITAGADVTA